ncbi:MAG TPA: APC family permease [Pseudonocardiaceae bacterium]|nr:APC family permease [Pseudonocardiaceae bacterium]
MPSSNAATLTPKIGLSGLVFFGLSYMTIAVGMLIFGILSDTSENTTATAFVVATGVMLVTAVSYAKLSAAYPKSGSVYSYARNLLGGRAGFLSGWLLLLDYPFLPMVATYLGALYLHAQFTEIPLWGWLLGLTAIVTGINIVGLKAADLVNKAFVVGSAIIVLIVMGLFVAHVATHPHGSYAAPFWHSGSQISGVTAAAAIAAYSFLGFDAITTLSEEAFDARRMVPRALVLVVLIGGAVFTLVAYILQLAIPSVDPSTADVAWYAALGNIAGYTVTNTLNVLLIIFSFSSAVAIQAGSSRLMYVMGRDGVLPRFFCGYLSRRFETPVLNIILIGAITLAGTAFDLSQATSLINFGAFAAFTVVNICAIKYYLDARRAGGHRRGALVVGLLVPAFGVIANVYLIFQLSSLAKILGISWFVVGVGWLVWLTRGLRREPPQFSEAEALLAE